jgi:LysM repeat protein/ABC-type branched-subunit amino acid transport system substrate-binding protein
MFGWNISGSRYIKYWIPYIGMIKNLIQMKKNLTTTLLSLLFLLFSSISVVGQNLNYPKKVIDGKEYYEYTVQKSEGFYSISKKFNITQEEIKAVNPGTENGLFRGAVLLIPVKNNNYTVHQVEKKETIFSLTQKYDITADELYELNPGLKKDGLKSGTEIKIPKKNITAQTLTVSDSVPRLKKENKAGFSSHEVKQGETLSSIGREYGITVEEIIRLNPDSREGVKIGQKLIIPSAGNAVSKQEETEKKKYRYHEVKKGETLYNISKKYGISEGEITRLNPNTKESVRIGQMLVIPPAFAHTSVKRDTIDRSYRYHEVKQGETLYSISKKYGVAEGEITRLNPESRNNMKVGQMLVIPPAFANTAVKQETVNRSYRYHEVKQGETLYSISKNYGILENEITRLNPEVKEGLKVGKVLIIPPAYSNTAIAREITGDSLFPATTGENVVMDSISATTWLERLFTRSTEPKRLINIALALPFQLDKVTQNSKIDGNTDKFLEFYQGMLLAIDSLRKTGLSFNFYVFDSGRTEMETKAMLEKQELKNMDILIGPAYTAQIKPMSDFALMNNVKLVIPFSSRSDDTKINPNIIQINTPLPQQYELTADLITDYFKDKNIVFIRFKTDSYNDKYALGDTVEMILRTRNIPFKKVEYGTMENIRNELSGIHENILIPLTTNQVALSQILPVLNMLGEKNKISLLGFPEWQTYQSISKDLFRLNTYFTSSFYIDYKDPEVKNYLRKYRSFYNSEPVNASPQYSMLGYDITMFFSQAVARYGHDFERDMDKLSDIKLLQMDFRFKQINPNGGYYNNNMFLINHNDETGTTKIKVKE